jgi:hypothetical protein
LAKSNSFDCRLHKFRSTTLSSESESESESYVTTDGQSASLSWYKAPIRGLRPDFYFRTECGIRLTVTFLNPWGALSNERTGLFYFLLSHRPGSAWVSGYIVSDRITAQKTCPLTSNGRLLLSRIRWNVFTESLLSNGHGVDPHRKHLLQHLFYYRVRICCGLFAESLPSNGYMRHDNKTCICMKVAFT